MFAHRDLPDETMPTIIRSIPTNNRTMPSIQMSETKAFPGRASINIDIIITRIPRPICTARIHEGFLSIANICTSLLPYLYGSTLF